MAWDMIYYPSDDDVRSMQRNLDGVPQLLKALLFELVQNNVQVASIGQTIVQATRPRSYISPILLALSSSLDDVFGSRWLIDTFHKLGFYLGHAEVLRHKQSAVRLQNIDSFAKYPFHAVDRR